MSRARQGGLRPNRRHVQRGSDMISFVLDVAGKTQSSLPIPLHLSFRTDREDALFAAIFFPHERHSILPSLFRDAQVDVSHEGRPW